MRERRALGAAGRPRRVDDREEVVLAERGGALVEIVPAHVRTTCFSLAFALAAALFGTFTPFASTWLIERTGDKASPGFWLMFAALLGIIAASTVYRSGGKAVPTYDAVAEPVAGH